MGLKTRSSGQAGGPIGGVGGGSESEDWVDVSAEMPDVTVGAIIDIIGPEGTGRSTLALSMPGPIAYINSDEKIDGIVQPIVRDTGKQVRLYTYGFIASNDKQDTLTRAEAVWGKVKFKVRDSINWAKTCIIDTHTESWEMCRLANFGELNPKGNRMDNLYGPVNAEFRTMMKEFRIAKKSNLVTIHQTKDEYKDVKDGSTTKSIRTGETKRSGFKEMGYVANVVIRTSKAPGGVFRATVEKGWFNAATEGMTVEGEECRLPYILSLITGLDEANWS